MHRPPSPSPAWMGAEGRDFFAPDVLYEPFEQKVTSVY
ncbi:hypothetical protein SAMN05444745_103293 [Arthrobacter sp. OV608]|nr:hypothetical protein SAMN05444745_103293 [Arthrobacter sp. OV608]